VGVSDERNEDGFEPQDLEHDDELTDDSESGDGLDDELTDDPESGDGLDDEEADGGDVHDEAAEGSQVPATFAGRRQWEGLPSSGLTEEFTEVEREMAEGLEEDLDDGEETAALATDDDEEPEPEGEDVKPTEPAEPSDSGETIESNTPALADQEEAREKAMAGLRERTQESQAKRGVTEPDTSGGEDATEVAPSPAEPGQPPAAPVAAAVADEEPSANEQKPPKSWLWARFVTASFLIIVSMATATSVSLLVYLTDIARGLGGLEHLEGELTAVEGGEPQNFLILGSDVRPGETGHGRSDTTILLRIDPNSDFISMLSIPRDFRTNIPEHGIDRFNAAYSYGGPKLTTQTVKDITDDRIEINHVVNVDFNGFADAVNAIGCVYIDVDRHYFVPPEASYAEIDISAGYQRLCGLKALQYVRYRHDDNDLVRSGRQQSFLREARAQVPPGTLLDERNRLIDIFTSYTSSDIDDTATLVELFKLMLGARGAQINRVEWPTTSLGDEQGYVTSSTEGVQEAVTKFLNGGVAPGESEQPASEGRAESEGEKRKGEKENEPKKPPPPPPLIDSTATGQQYASLLAQDAGDEIKFPIAYPTRIAPGSGIAEDSRWFRIDGPGNEIYRGYKIVVSVPGTSYPTAYYGVSGTDWLNAPVFANPSETTEIGGREYKLYYDSGQLRMVAWQKGKAMYWVSNTLDKLLSNAEMLEIAKYVAVPGGG